MTSPEPYNSFFDACLLGALMVPLLSFLMAHLISSRYGWLVSVLSPLLSLGSLVLAMIVFFTAWNGAPYQLTWTWFHLAGQTITAGFYVDSVSLMMVVVVSVISFIVHLYSTGYMAGDSGIARYFGMLGFFTFSMLGLVLSSNLLLIFIFWELVGFSSYMLIGHWRERPQAATAARKAFIINKVGDAGFLIGLLMIWTYCGTWDIHQLQLNLTAPFSWQTVASLFLFGGIAGKSAQFPLQAWLPDAMEGPTPVSALIHAATMVAAGVFLLARVNFMFTTDAREVIVIIGSVTALLAGLSALAQTDLKKVLAYSTISQLGFMMMAHGVGATAAANMHLFAHAFFKACLFLSAGSIIHVVHQAQYHGQVHVDLQDIRNLGGLRKRMPFTFFTFLISSCALAGLPLFSGFLSKDAILEAIFQWKGSDLSWRWLILLAAFAVSFITVLYIFRLMVCVFAGEERSTRSMTISDPPGIMRFSMALLAIGSGWFILSWNPAGYQGWLYTSLHSAGESPVGLISFVSAVWVILACGAAYFLFRNRSHYSNAVLRSGFYWDKMQEVLFGRPTVQLSLVAERIDKRWLDGVVHFITYIQVTVAHITGWVDSAIVDGMVNGLAAGARAIGSFTRSFQGGKIQLYIFWSLFTIIIFLIWILF